MTYKEQKGLKFLKNISPHLYRFKYDEVKIWLKDYVPQIPISYKQQDTFPRPQEDMWARHPKSLCRARENDIKYAFNDLNYPFNKVSKISHVPLDNYHQLKSWAEQTYRMKVDFIVLIIQLLPVWNV